MRKIKKFIYYLLSIISLFFIVIILFKMNGYILNNTSSYPIGIYKIIKTNFYKKGTLVSFCAPENDTIEKLVRFGFAPANETCKNGTPVLLKKIVAVENDYIELKDNHIYINSALQPKSKIFLVGSGGNILERQNNQTIKKGYFWAMSDYNERSYDSRYFGQIPLKNIKGTAVPILLW